MQLSTFMARVAKWMQKRPHLPAAALAGAMAVMAAGWGLWSCQTTPQPPARAQLPELPSTEPEIRVRIRAGVASVKLTGPEEFLVRAGVGESARMPGPLTVAATDTGCRITDGKENVRPVSSSGAVEIEAVPGGSMAATPFRIRVDGITFPGRMRILPRGGSNVADAAGAGGALVGPPVLGAQVSDPPGSRAGKAPGLAHVAPKMDVIEVAPIETYLTGVIVSEMPKQWPLAAFQVQAVCARTYALHERQRGIKAGRAWDVDAGEIDQAYNGGLEVPTAAKAVADTRGVVLTTEGHLLRAYYSSTCGGRTAGAASVWPTGPGFEFNLDAPIQANVREALCQGSPVYRWSITRDRADLSKQIREWGKANNQPAGKMGTIESLKVDAANKVGRPTRYVITDDAGGTYPIAAELLRVACNFSMAGVKPVTKDTRVRSGDMEMDVSPSEVTIRGRGFGHGVGMCQYCAKAMADRGDAWQDMLARFYPGAKLERAY